MDTELPPFQRLAMAYAPAQSRQAWRAIFTLDSRLAGVVRSGREPLLTQIRLAWWRERLEESAALLPEGEPLLAALDGAFSADRRILASLVNGWEAMTGDAPLPPDVLEAMAEGRADAIALVAAISGANQPEARRLGRNWALADLATNLSHPQEREAAITLALQQDWRSARLPRAMRPLVVLHGLARSTVGQPGHRPPGVVALIRAMRLGIMGI